MGRIVERVPLDASSDKPFSKKALDGLTEYLTCNIEDSIKARVSIDAIWKTCFRQLEGVPKKAVRNTPIENAPNFEVEIGAIAADAVFSAMLDLLFQVDPTLTCLPLDERFVEAVKALQRWTNWCVPNEFMLRDAAEQCLLDTTQLGTGYLYTPFVEDIKKGKRIKVTSRGARIMCVPPEDMFVFGGAYEDIQLIDGVFMRQRLTKEQLQERKVLRGWDISKVEIAGGIDDVRLARENVGRTKRVGKRTTDQYEIFECYCYYDIDGDGIAEDLYVVWDRTSKTVLKAAYNPYDRRPFEVARYQPRPHVFYGKGIQEMLSNMQDGLSDIFCQDMLNMLLVNSRIWVDAENRAPENFKIWPGKKVDFPLTGEQMADVYPSARMTEQFIMALAQQRIGVNELSQADSPNFSSRTPATTAVTMQQNASRRFAAAFDSIRLCVAGAARQGLYRQQERLLAGDLAVEAKMRTVLGDGDSALVIGLMKNPDFDAAVSVELTASSATINRNADQQVFLALMDRLSVYYRGIAELQAAPNINPEIKTKITDALGELLDRGLRSFPQIRDPSRFIIQVSNAEASANQPTAQQNGVGEPAGAEQGLAGLISAFTGGGQA